MSSFNELMNRGTELGKDLIKNVSDTQFFKDIVPSKDAFTKEVNNFINSNEAIKLNIKRPDINNNLKTISGGIVETLNLSDKKAKELNNILLNNDDIDKALDKYKEALQKDTSITKKQAEKLAKNIKKRAYDNINELEVTSDDLNNFQKLSVPAKAYFSNPNAKIKNERIATAIGAYAGIATGARYLSGGTLTTDKYGQNDITGIPFI